MEELSHQRLARGTLDRVPRRAFHAEAVALVIEYSIPVVSKVARQPFSS